jgi:hypothetical protein
LFEESPSPAFHARDRRPKSITDIGRAVTGLLPTTQGAKVYVFCSSEPPELTNYPWPTPVTLVTPQRGFVDAAESLWLLSRARHHVFANSTFYWWGAWLSQTRYAPNSQIILAADNFINKDGVPPHWAKF